MSDPTIPELVARLRELHEKATPGPWSTNHRGGDISARIRGHEVQVALACGQGAMWDERDDAAAIMRANAELIAELRSALPDILDALERGTTTRAEEPPPSASWELENGVVYLGWFSDGAPRLVTYHLGKWYRYTDGRDAHGLTHVHRMGPIRGPEETR